MSLAARGPDHYDPVDGAPYAAPSNRSAFADHLVDSVFDLGAVGRAKHADWSLETDDALLAMATLREAVSGSCGVTD